MSADYPFSDQKNTATITCCHVMNGQAPILHVSHDADDGMWQFLCGKPHHSEDAMVVGLEEVYNLDNSIGDIADLPLGYVADRKKIGKKWKVSKHG